MKSIGFRCRAQSGFRCRVSGVRKRQAWGMGYIKNSEWGWRNADIKREKTAFQTFLNAHLIKSGFAETDPETDHKYFKRFISYQKKSKKLLVEKNHE